MQPDSYDQLKSVMDGIPDPVVVICSDLSISYMNRAAGEICRSGTQGGALLRCHELLHGTSAPCEQTDELCPALEVFRTGRPVRVYRHRSENGQGEHAVEVSLSPLFNDRGAVVEVVEVLHRVDEREIAERLIAAEDRFRGIVESAGDGIITMNEKGTILFANNSTAKISGYEVRELVGQPTAMLMPDRLRSEFFSSDLTPLRSRLDALEGKTAELIGLRKDGLEIPIELSLSSWKTGGTVHHNAIIRDITPRRRAEIELRVSREAILKEHEELTRVFKLVELAKREWEKTMDCVFDMVVLSDTRGRIKRCNKAFKEFAGKTYDQVLGRSVFELLSDRGVKIPEQFSGEIDADLPSENRWFRLSAYPVRGIEGDQVSGTVITIHDNTQIKRMTQKLEQTNREIEGAYSELKQTQTKILQQEKMASIGQLAAGVAHEINNPIGFVSSNLNTLDKYLAKILEYVDMVNRSTPAAGGDALANARSRLKIDFLMEDARKLVAESLDGTARVRTIVQNLKSFSRIDEAEAKPADINECIETTLNIVWNELKYKATVTKEYGTLPQTRCFPQQLNQVFMNLLVNASHAIEKQGVIAIRTWPENGAIYASVSDTGCGIPPENLTRIFEPFFTTKEVGKGTGLGLSITYDIVKKHNGELSVRSEPGKGTTFTVKIPVVEANRHE